MGNIGEWFNGKKTAIGAIVSLATAYGISKGWIGESEQTLFLGLSAALVAGGVGHKIIKARKKDNG